MKKIYRAAIIGAGNIGAFYSPPHDYTGVITHAHAYTKEPRTELTAFVDVDKKKAQNAAQLWQTRAYTDVKEMFTKERPEIVSICTPDHVHEQTLLESLEFKPKLVFCEKPFTTNYQIGKQIVSQYLRSKIPVAVNYTRRYNCQFIHLKKQITQNKFGKCLNAVGIYNKGLLHNGSHMIDLFRFFFGEAEKYIPLSARVDFRKEDPTIDGFLTFANGCQAHVVGTNAQDYAIFELDMLFSNNRLRLLKSGEVLENTPIGYSKLLRTEKIMGKSQIIKTNLTNTLLEIPALLIETIETNKPLPCPANEALQTQKLCQSMIEIWKN